MKRSRLCLSIVAALFLASTARADGYGNAEALLETSTTNLGQPLHYPQDGVPRIASLIVTLLPGEETGPHRHPVPTYGHVLSGEVKIDYGERGVKTYRAGDSFIEAVDVWHNGRNNADEPVSILVVFMGAKDMPNIERP